MVLIFLILTLIGVESQGELLIKYNKPVKKAIKKTIDLDDFQLLKTEFDFGELYSINYNAQQFGYVLVAEVAACTLGGCPVYKSIETDTNAEYFDILVIIDPNSNLLHLKVLDYFSDYGYEVTSKSYLKKFVGKNLNDFLNESDGIDAISGATISSYALEAKLSQLSLAFDL